MTKGRPYVMHDLEFIIKFVFLPRHTTGSPRSIDEFTSVVCFCISGEVSGMIFSRLHVFQFLGFFVSVPTLAQLLERKYREQR